MTDEQRADEIPATTASTASPSALAGTDQGRRAGQGARDSSERTGADGAPSEEVIPLYYQTRFGVLKSLRYLAKRRSFFDGLHSLSKALSAIFGSVAFTALVGTGETGVAKWSAFGIAIASGADLAFGFAERARKADAQYRRFAELAADIEAMDAMALQPKAVRSAAAKRLIIEKDDPTPLFALNIICHNEEAEAEGRAADLYIVGWVQRGVANLITFPWFSLRPQSSRSSASLTLPVVE